MSTSEQNKREQVAALAREKAIFVKMANQQWGIIGPHDVMQAALANGHHVTVHKKDDTTAVVKIGNIIEHGNGTVTCEFIEHVDDEAPPRKRGKGRSRYNPNSPSLAHWAVKMLERLERHGYWESTTDLFDGLQVSKAMRGHLLEVLHRLHGLELLARTSDKPFKWKRTEKAYDPANPFGLDANTLPKARKKREPKPASEVRLVIVDEPAPPVKEESKETKGERHRIFDDIVALAKAKQNILLVGPAGCGKSTLAEQLASYLEMDFAAISFNGQTSVGDVIGKTKHSITDKPNSWQTVPTLEVFQHGGVNLLDELDRADGNTVAVLNMMLMPPGKGRVCLPRDDKATIMRNADCVFIATMNTWGRGATRQFSNANALDDSTLDRFRIGTLEVDYDKDVEAKLCPDDVLCIRLWRIREKMIEAGLDKTRTLSTRFFEQAYAMRQAGWSVDKIIGQFFQGWKADEKARVS